ncbi:MAG: AmmeMemoRadiSam system radical SAM enzyme [Deltaproteobacteria bacterium]|nr:AmmeMemoRadiSam system radical SAM enzyme [Deltaproteobacteria bacterium]
MREAFLYEKLACEQVQCRLCAHYCLIKPGGRGVCTVRENREGILYSLVYNRPIAQHIDPIEKKPLFHFLPGSLSYSIATVGCNFRCRFCQNANISQMPRDEKRIVGQEVSAEEVVAEAKAHGCASISYTYTEPTIFGEYVYDIATLARQAGIKNVLVTNGYQSPEAREKLGPIIDAANVDLKSFKESFYKEQCGAKLAPVLETLTSFKEQGVWIEVTTLIIPGLNDSPVELKEIAGFIASRLGAETPWHISRFHPDYRLTDRPGTPVATLERAAQIGRAAGLKYVYLGNAPGAGGETTCCPGCGARLIDRLGFTISLNRVPEGTCPECGARVDGVF